MRIQQSHDLRSQSNSRSWFNVCVIFLQHLWKIKLTCFHDNFLFLFIHTLQSNDNSCSSGSWIRTFFLILTSRPLPLLVFIIFVWHIINREDSVSSKMQKNYHTYYQRNKKNTNSNFLQLLFVPSLYSKFPTLLLNCGNVSLTNGKDWESTMCQWRTLNLLYDKASWQAQRMMVIFTSLQVTIIFYSQTGTITQWN